MNGSVEGKENNFFVSFNSQHLTILLLPHSVTFFYFNYTTIWVIEN